MVIIDKNTMEITTLNNRIILKNTSYQNSFEKLTLLLNELNTKNIPEHIIVQINILVNEINDSTSDRQYLINLEENKSKIIKVVEKDIKLVPKNYYRNTWLVLGMTSFGLPLGVCFGLLMDNMALLATGLPIGMGIGVLVGSRMDKKAFEENRQLLTEIK